MESKEKQMKELLVKLLDTASKFDLAYVHAISHNRESSFTGEEYEKLSDVLVEVEEFLTE